MGFEAVIPGPLPDHLVGECDQCRTHVDPSSALLAKQSSPQTRRRIRLTHVDSRPLHLEAIPRVKAEHYDVRRPCREFDPSFMTSRRRRRSLNRRRATY